MKVKNKNKNIFLHILLALYSGLLPFDNLIFISPLQGTITKYLMILISAIIISMIAVKRYKLKLPSSAQIWILFAVFVSISVIWSISPTLSIKSGVTLVGLIFTFIILTMYPWQKDEFILIEKAIILGGVTAGAISISLAKLGYYYLDSVRATISFGESSADPNHFASSLVLPLCFSISKLVYNKVNEKGKINYIMFFISSVILIAAIIMSGSRGGTIGAIIATLILILRSGKPYKVFAAVFIMMILAFIVLQVFMPHSIIERFKIDYIINAKAAGRVDLWKVGILAFLEKPLIGWGYNSFPIITAGEFPESEYLRVRYGQVTHNIYLQILCELGLIGFIIFILALYKTIKSALMLSDLYPIYMPISSALMGVLVISLSLGTLNYKYFWLIIFLCTIDFYSR